MSILINITHASSCLGLMSHHWVNNEYNRVKGQHWRWLIYVLHNFLLRNNKLRFSEATTTVLKSFTNCREKPLCWSLFFSLRCWNYIKKFVLESDLWKFRKKHLFHNKHIYMYMGHRHFRVLGSFVLNML